MDIQSFVRKAGSRLHGYRTAYRILDVLLSTLFFYAVLTFFNFDAFFLLIKPIEPYVGRTIDIGDIAIRYETLMLFVPAFILGLLFLAILPKILPFISPKRISAFAKKSAGKSKNVRETIQKKKIERRIAKARKAAGKSSRKKPGILAGLKDAVIPASFSAKFKKNKNETGGAAAYSGQSASGAFSRKKKGKRVKTSAKAVCINDAIDMVETNYPTLKYRLRTAYDNAESDSFISADLSAKVSEELKGVSLSCLLNKRKVGMDIAGIFILTILVGAVIFSGVSAPVNMSGFVNNLQSGDSDDKGLNADMSDPNFGNSDDNSTSSSESTISSPPTISQEAGTAVNVSLPPGSGIGPGSELDAENSSETFGPSVNYDPTILAAGHYEDNLPEGYETVIRQYFEKVAENS